MLIVPRPLLFLFLLSAPAAAQEPDRAPPPTPRPSIEQEEKAPQKPIEVGPREKAVDLPPPPADEAALTACEAELTALGARFERKPAIDGTGTCGMAASYALSAVAAGITLTPATEMTCQAALATARWINLFVVPAAQALGPEIRLTGVAHASTYVCRNRTTKDDAKQSEHASGTAIDIARFSFDGREPIAVAPRQGEGSIEEAFQRAVRATACLQFTTVLGPGSDAYHDDHLHLDLADRKGGFRLCQ